MSNRFTLVNIKSSNRFIPRSLVHTHKLFVIIQSQRWKLIFAHHNRFEHNRNHRANNDTNKPHHHEIPNNAGNRNFKLPLLHDRCRSRLGRCRKCEYQIQNWTMDIVQSTMHCSWKETRKTIIPVESSRRVTECHFFYSGYSQLSDWWNTSRMQHIRRMLCQMLMAKFVFNFQG